MILSVDSQLLNSVQACSTKARYSFIENLQPQTKAVALEKGDLIHKCLEIYDGVRGKCVNFDSDTWRALEEAGIYVMSSTSKIEDFGFDDLLKFATEAGRYFASKMELDTEVSGLVIYQFSEYCKFYQNDPWSTLAVEEVASKILYDGLLHENSLSSGEELTIIYNGKIDRVVEQGTIRAPMDHKSSDRRQDPSSLSNQFIGYCWLMGMNNIIIDKIGFQKTLKPIERFQRYILPIDDQRMSEWVQNSIWWLKLWAAQLKEGHFPMNLTSCDKYGSCIYSSICESNPEGRAWKMERDYKVGEVWDVAKVLENKNG